MIIDSGWHGDHSRGCKSNNALLERDMAGIANEGATKPTDL